MLATFCRKNGRECAQKARISHQNAPSVAVQGKGMFVGDAGKQKTILVGTGSMGD